MPKQNSFIGYLLIAAGVFFLLKKANIAALEPFYTWPSILIIVGLSLLLHAYTEKQFENLFVAVIVLALGVHFHGLMHYENWINHWAIYPLIVGVAFIIRAFRTKKGLAAGLILTGLSVFMLFSVKMPEWFNIIYNGVDSLQVFWPILLIVIGFYYTRKKPKAS